MTTSTDIHAARDRSSVHRTDSVLVTGGSQGLGRALAEALADSARQVVVDARDGDRLATAVRGIGSGSVHPVPGDITDAGHRDALAAEVGDRLDLLVLNASTLGPSPLPFLADYGTEALRAVFETNVIAQYALVQRLLPAIRAASGRIVAISSDAAVAAYEGWGGYGASKAAFDHLAAVLAVEEPAIRVFSVDPGDMRTAMHQAAFPGEDISDRPEPETVVPPLLRLIGSDRPSGRYTLADLAVGNPA